MSCFRGAHGLQGKRPRERSPLREMQGCSGLWSPEEALGSAWEGGEDKEGFLETATDSWVLTN